MRRAPLLLSIIPLAVILLLFLSTHQHDYSSTHTLWELLPNNSKNSNSSSLKTKLLQPIIPPAQAPLPAFPEPQTTLEEPIIPPAQAPLPAFPEPQTTLGEQEADLGRQIERARLLRRNSSLYKQETSLSRARLSIREAGFSSDVEEDKDLVPRGPIYRNPNAFHRSYLEMEKLMKIYVYEEGEPPIFHEGPCRSIYSSEGRFIHEMEKEGNLFRTRDPNKALVFFLPFSVTGMVRYLYTKEEHDLSGIRRVVVDYVELISRKHVYWNRSLGADHFMLSCHDWGPRTSSYVPSLYSNSIRVLCNANTSEGFNPSKDVSLPEINLLTGEVRSLGGPSPSARPILAFFAGRLHGHIRYLLLKQWKDKDNDVQVYDQLPKGVSYDAMLKKSRFCLCPSGYEVASPRIVEAMYSDCVPVLISDSYVPPFNDVLNWKSFSVEIKVNDIANIKKILSSISTRQYLRLQRRVKQVQRHFVVSNGVPKRYDVFHMILHSIWLRRLNIRIQDLNQITG